MLGGDPTSTALAVRTSTAYDSQRVEGEVKADFSIGVIGAVDVLAGRVGRRGGNVAVRGGADTARTNAEVLISCCGSSHSAQRVLRYPRPIEMV